MSSSVKSPAAPSATRGGGGSIGRSDWVRSPPRPPDEHLLPIGPHRSSAAPRCFMTCVPAGATRTGSSSPSPSPRPQRAHSSTLDSPFANGRAVEANAAGEHEDRKVTAAVRRDAEGEHSPLREMMAGEVCGGRAGPCAHTCAKTVS